jgi:hypothetical protein
VVDQGLSSALLSTKGVVTYIVLGINQKFSSTTGHDFGLDGRSTIRIAKNLSCCVPLSENDCNDRIVSALGGRRDDVVLLSPLQQRTDGFARALRQNASRARHAVELTVTPTDAEDDHGRSRDERW